jgi:pimeloyl-ACP methyl ester carboxylesterase
MTKAREAAGTFRNGLPYNRLGHGPRILVVFQGLPFENKPLTGLSARLKLSPNNFFQEAYTAYGVTRKPGLPEGYSMRNMADDYAVMIREEFGGPIDVIRTSIGGSVDRHFAADRPDLIRWLVLHASAYTLGDAVKEIQMRVGHLARQRERGEACAVLNARFILYPGKGHAPGGKQFSQDVLTSLYSG